jgi:hypothetical protein
MHTCLWSNVSVFVEEYKMRSLEVSSKGTKSHASCLKKTLLYLALSACLLEMPTGDMLLLTNKYLCLFEGYVFSGRTRYLQLLQKHLLTDVPPVGRRYLCSVCLHFFGRDASCRYLQEMYLFVEEGAFPLQKCLYWLRDSKSRSPKVSILRRCAPPVAEMSPLTYWWNASVTEDLSAYYQPCWKYASLSKECLCFSKRHLYWS